MFFGGLVPIYMLQGKNVLCVREVQNSIRDSVKRLIESQIEKMGIGRFFHILDTEIRCTLTGAICVFRGLQNHTADSVKSLEGFHLAWVEEAQTISQKSLDLLTPTIRAPGSQLAFTWNPVSATDPIDVMLRTEQRDNAVVVEANWSDNPWFPDSLRDDMERDRARQPDKYLHVWGGRYRTMSEARVFRNWRVEDMDNSVDDNAVWFYGIDFGFSQDPTAGVRFCIIGKRTLYITHETWGVGVANEALPALLHKLPGVHQWTSFADSARPETIDYLRRNGLPQIRPVKKGKGSVEDGIMFLQGMDIVVHPRCANMQLELASYSYRIDKQTNLILPQVEDANNHLCVAEGQRVLTSRGLVPIECVRVGDMAMTRQGLRMVTAARQTGADRDVVTVRTTRGDLTCTPDHRVWNGDGFVRADAMSRGDHVLGDEASHRTDHRPVLGRVLAVSPALRAARVFDLTVDGAHEYFAEGALVHNCDALRYAASRLHVRSKLVSVAERDTISRIRSDDYGGAEYDEPNDWKVA